MSKPINDLADAMIKVIDKLAGKESDIKLSFQDLTVEVAMVKARLNGAIVLDIRYVIENKAKLEK